MDLASKYDHWSDACVWLNVASFMSLSVRVEKPPPLSVAMAASTAMTTIVSETYFVQRSRFSFSFCATCSARNSATNSFNSFKSDDSMMMICSKNSLPAPATGAKTGGQDGETPAACPVPVAGQPEQVCILIVPPNEKWRGARRLRHFRIASL